jgi:hypothetical protein
MKEAFMSVQEFADQTTAFADLELQSYLAALPPEQKDQFVAGQIAGAVAAVELEKQNKFNESSDKISGLDNNISSVMYYLARTRDLKHMASDVDTITQKQLSTINSNHDLSIRQHEVNEWANSNKLDTLYFLQLLFVTLSFIGVLLFLKVNGLITGTLFTMLTAISGVLLVLVLIIRYRYTAVARNNRYWSKSRFPSQPDRVSSSVNLNCPPAST